MQGEHIKIPQTLYNNEKESSRTEFLNNIIYTAILVLKNIIEFNIYVFSSIVYA